MRIHLDTRRTAAVERSLANRQSRSMTCGLLVVESRWKGRHSVLGSGFWLIDEEERNKARTDTVIRVQMESRRTLD